MRDVPEEVLIVVRVPGRMGHYGQPGGISVRPDMPDMEIGDAIIRVFLNGPPNCRHGLFIDTAVEQDLTGIPQQTV